MPPFFMQAMATNDCNKGVRVELESEELSSDKPATIRVYDPNDNLVAVVKVSRRREFAPYGTWCDLIQLTLIEEPQAEK